jgi:hypothetical protein
MGRHSNWPTLYDECHVISISSLKKWGYLKPGIWKSGTVTWSRSGNQTGSISIAVNMFGEIPFIELDYKCNGEPIKYEVKLVTIPSNLGRGKVWYFLCPRTGKRCRILYLGQTYFLHRKAFSGCMYEKQTYSKRNRGLNRSFERLFAPEKAYDQIYSKHFKTHYGGKPTKRFIRLQKMIRAAEAISESELIYSIKKSFD